MSTSTYNDNTAITTVYRTCLKSKTLLVGIPCTSC